MTTVHHTAIRVGDVEASLRFWRDGLGFHLLMDERFEGDWPTLLSAPSQSLRSVFLGSAASPDGGIVELVDLGPVEPGRPVPDPPPAGFLLISVMTDVEGALARLADLELGGAPRRIEVMGVAMATVVDPDGVFVELVAAAAGDNLRSMGSP
jgi:catechol 2,3-dioxygenase-like lactoylglutathione lyase family enzyme